MFYLFLEVPLKEVKGMGAISVKRFGAEILDIVLHFLNKEHDTADIGEMPEKPKKPKGETYLITKELFDRGLSVEAIAKERGFAVSTIYGHLAYWVEQGAIEASQIVEKEKYNEILEYFESTFDPDVTMAKDVLGDDYQYGEIKAVLAELQQEHFFDDLSEENS